MPEASAPERPYTSRQRVGLILGPLALILLLLLPPPEGMSTEGWRTTAVGLWMALWWVTEAIPIPATALLPLVLFPSLGILAMGEAAAPYANPLVFLFLGGFVLALAMQRWELHRRIALSIVRAMGTKPHMLVLGFYIATGFLSMWVSNTATAVMMLPIGLSVIDLVLRAHPGSRDPADSHFAVNLMLGIAYAASIGGLATLIGTPPNALLAGFMLEAYGVEIGFAQWLLVGLPLVAVMLPLTWLVLTRLVYPIRIREIPGGREMIEREVRALGPMSRAEISVAIVFVLTALAWIFRPLLEGAVPGISDTSIAIAAALVLFVIPVDLKRSEWVMNWEWAERLPWGVLLLFGGGLALADAVKETGLAEWIGGSLSGLSAWPTLALIFAVTVLILFLTELTSNTATAAAFLPVVSALAVGLGENPLLLAIPAALAASCAFMLPVATPPNAIVFGSSFITIPQMARAGLVLNLMFVVAITLLTYTLVLAVFGVELGVVPSWATGR